MNKTCQEFREQLLRHWEAQETIEPFLSAHAHPDSCSGCRRYLAEFQALVERLSASREAVVQEPDFHRLRAKVWDNIDVRWDQVGPGRRLLRPGVLGPVFAAIVALLVWWAVSQNPPHRSTADMNELMYSAAVEELKPDNYPDETIHSVMDAEMSNSIYDYFISQKDYSTIQTISASAGDWDQIAQAMADQNM